MRAPLAALLLLAAAMPAAAQGKFWERSKQFSCSIATFHACTEQSCETKQVSATFKIDLGAMQLCLLDGDRCTETETIGTVKTMDRLLMIYSGQDKPDASVVRIWDDGRFTAIGLREISGTDAGEGGVVMLGKCGG